jgi:hypothetical protein
MTPHFDVNVITVGMDKFTPEKLVQVDAAVAIMKGVFATFGPEVGTVRKFRIPFRDVGVLAVIRNEEDARELTNLWSVKNDALDLFVVPVIASWKFAGLSPSPGDCSKKRVKADRLRAPVVSIEQLTAESGSTFAHEVGHFLGLKHCENDPSLCVGTSNNFMMAASSANTGITAAQADLMKTHCLVRP